MVWTGTEHFPGWSLESKYGPNLMNTGDTEFREAVNECIHIKLTFQRLNSWERNLREGKGGARESLAKDPKSQMEDRFSDNIYIIHISKYQKRL